MTRPAAPPTFDEPERFAPSVAELSAIRRRADALAAAVEQLRRAVPAADPRSADVVADVEVVLQGVERTLRLGDFFDPKGPAAALDALELGHRRAAATLERLAPPEGPPGGSVRGYVSKLDGSVQPYAVYVPDAAFGPDARLRLDVVLHGRDATLSEVKFFRQHEGKPYPEGETGLILHAFGRGNVAYRWAGEADVFEAIEAVRRRFPIDGRRILLRGFSMGGAGAWHLGLHHPAAWAAVEAGAGFVESKVYAHLGPLPDYQEKTLHIYDAADYALNAYDVPIAGYGGEDDPQLAASSTIRAALEGLGVPMETEGLVARSERPDALFVVGARTGHRVDPASAALLKTFRDEHAEAGRDPYPAEIRFVTYTLKYDRADWVRVVRLTEHYRRATVAAKVLDGVVDVAAEGVAVLAVDREAGQSIRFGAQEFPLAAAVGRYLPEVYFRAVEAGWELLDYEASRALQRNDRREKRRGLQGPIDDAFGGGPFLCVRPTGAPWQPEVSRWAEARLGRFVDDWRRFLRGEARVVDDVDVAPADFRESHLILFGDPGSNRVIAELLPGLPLSWTREAVELGGRFAASGHAPALIAPSPRDVNRYVVLNSGHTFGAEAFRGTNALLYPRLGDWAVFAVGDGGGAVAASGFFDESWRLE